MYNASYLYSGGGNLDDIYKPAVRDLYTKLHDRLSPWRIFRLSARNDATEQLFIVTLGPNLRFYAKKSTAEKSFALSYEFGEGYKNKFPTAISWDCTVSTVDIVVEDIITMIHWYEPKYTEFMQEHKRNTDRDKLMQKINIEVDYHPDSPTIQLLNDHFNKLNVEKD